MTAIDWAFIKAVLVIIVIMGSFGFWVTMDSKKRWILYDAKKLRKDKNDDRYIRHFVVWLKDVLKKQKFKYQEISIKGKDKEYPYFLKINNYGCNISFRGKEHFRRYLTALKEGIMIGQEIFKKGKK